MIRKKHSFKRVVALMATVSVLAMTGCSNGEESKDSTEITTTSNAETTTAENATSTTVEESSTTQIESTTTQEVTTTQPPTTTQEVATTQKKTQPPTTTQRETTTEKQTTTQPPTTTVRVEPKITASSRSMYLEDGSQINTITVTNFDGRLTFSVDNVNVVNCQWGEWNGNTIPLTFIPVGTGSTNVTVWLEGTDINVTIAVEVYKPTASDLSDIEIDKIQGEYKHYSSGLAYNVYRIDDAEPIITDSSTGGINIKIKMLVTCIEFNYSTTYMKIPYELYDVEGVCVESGTVMIKWNYVNQPYAEELNFFYLDPGEYKLVFRDCY